MYLKAFPGGSASASPRLYTRISPKRFVSLFLFLLLSTTYALADGPAATVTTLAVTVGGNAVTTAASGTPVTLTATVMQGSNTVTTGEVRFCDANAPYCTDIYIVGRAQLMTAGTAVARITPRVGSHSYKAVFAGTNLNATSASASSSLAITGASTTTSITATGNPGAYTLTAMVSAQGAASPAGSVSFQDTTTGGSPLATSPLSPAISLIGFGTAKATGVSGVGFATGDFNGDGHADLATLDETGKLNVALGNGDGTFQTLPPAALLTYTYVETVGVADFNSDGNVDLAIIGSSNEVAVLLGNGDGTFTLASNPTTGTSPDSLAIADWNGDGKPDMAVTNAQSNTVTVLLGNGDGTFIPTPVAPTTNRGPGPIAVGDFNGDGHADFVVLTYSDYTARVYSGNGDGTFTQVSLNSPSAFDVTSIVVGDLNKDGKPDLAMAMLGGVMTFLGNGDGTFITPGVYTRFTSNSIPAGLTLGDFDNDGNADLAFVSGGTPSTTGPALFLGHGDNSFTQIGPFDARPANSLSMADFNGDGYLDLAVLNRYSGSAAASVLIGLGASTSTATASSIALTGNGAHQVTANYIGGGDYVASTSNPISLVAKTTPPALTLSASPANTQYGQQVALTASLNPYTVLGQGTNGEIVTFYNGGVSLGSGSLSSGSVTLNTTSLPVGANDLTAVYAGDINFLGTTSNHLLFPVGQATPTISFNGFSGITYGTALSAGNIGATSSTPGTFTYTPALGTIPAKGTFTVNVSFNPTDTANYASISSSRTITVNPATLSVTAANATRIYGAPNPVVTATASGAVNGDVITTNASTTADTSSPVGTYAIVPTATGANIGNYSIRPINGVLTVSQASTLTSLTSSASSVLVGSSISFTATVIGTNGTPTGTVKFMNGSTVLATVPLTNATAVYATNALPVGSYTVVAVYSGDQNFKDSLSSGVPATITGLPDYSISSAQPTLTVKRGQSGTVALTVTPTNGYNQPVTFSCGNLPAAVTCSFSPSTITPSGAPITTQLTVTASTLASSDTGTRNSSIAFGFLLLLLPVAARRRTWTTRLLLLFASLSLIPFSGCAGSSTPSSGPSGSTSSTTVTLTATTSSGTTPTQHTIPLTITITN